MTTRLVTADLHFSDNPRDSYRYKIVNVLIDLIKKYDARKLIILGDLTEQKDNHSARLVNRVVEALDAWAEYTSVRIIRGNHDGTTADNPFFRFVDKIDSIQWIQDISSFGGDLYLPHTRDYKKDWAKVAWGNYDYVFCHQTFAGSRTAHFTGAIPSEAVQRAIRVISGDVHQPSTEDNITYVGSPYTIDFGDDYSPRILLLDSDNPRMKSIPIKMPMKRLVNLEWPHGPAGWTADLDKGDIVKVRVTLSDNNESWQDVIKQIRAWGEKKGLEIYSVEPVITNEPRDRKRSKKKAKTDEELLMTYAKTRNLADDVIDEGVKLL